MTVTVYRLAKGDRPSEHAFDGYYSKIYDGRWNHKGHACVYCASAGSLANLEVLINILNPKQLKLYFLYRATLKTADVQSIKKEDIPTDWRVAPAPRSTKSVGTEWLQTQSSLALEVPSAVIPVDSNYLINPNHPGFKNIHFKKLDFDIDPRIGLIGINLAGSA